MKNSKRIFSAGLATTMIAGSALTAFAAMPAQSIVVGNKAFDIDYAFAVQNEAEINAALLANDFDFYYKDFEGNWVDALGNTVQASTIPAVTYKNADGSVDTYAAADGDKQVAPVEGYALTINKAELLAASEAGDLVADGKTVMRVEASITVPEGQNAADFVGKAEFYSQYGLKSAQADAAFDKGKVVFNVQLPNNPTDIQDQIKVSITVHENNQLKGLATETVPLTYKGYVPGGGVNEQRVYTVDSVKSTDLADRVDVYVGNVNNADVEKVKAAIVDQLQLEKGGNGGTVIEAVKVIDAVQVGNPGVTSSSYAFRTLLELSNNGVRDEVAGNVLTDNSYNNYQVVNPSTDSNITLAVQDNADAKFMLIDGVKPSIETVKSSNLPSNTLLAQFNEAVNQGSATNPANWVINGNVLKATDLRAGGIQVLDVKEEITNTSTLAYDVLNNYASAVTAGKERGSVIIPLTATAAAKYLQTGDNLIQARSVSDIAGLTDLSDNNKITTQDFVFNYAPPVATADLEMVMESPEQFVLQLNKPLYATEDLDGTVYDMDAPGAIKVELINPSTGDVILTLDPADYVITALGDDKYILELTKDWTVLLDGILVDKKQVAYHNNLFRVTLVNTITGEDQVDDDGIDYLFNQYGVALSETALVDMIIPEDTTSPKVDDVEYLGAEVKSGLNVYTYDKALVDKPWAQGMPGHMTITMDEPVQIINDAGVSLMNPGKTTSIEQNGEDVPVPTFEYVKVASVGANPLYSAGSKVKGQLLNPGALDEHDMSFNVAPVVGLDEGEWKLVVRQTSDDVGNTMATQEFKFKVEYGAAEIVNPYIVWAYADDDFENADGSINDYVYILYSRDMKIDALRAATYNINGKQVAQDAAITSQLINMYDFGGAEVPAQWKGELVRIKLPSDFIVGGDDLADGDSGAFRKNALTVPRTLGAVNDNNADTVETLLFDNNGGSNQFELKFETTTPIEVPAIVVDRYADADEFIEDMFIATEALADAFDDVAALVKADYTEASWKVLEAALAKPERTIEEIEAKTTAINDAIDALVLVP